MELDRHKEQALVTWVNSIVQTKDQDMRIHGVEDVLEKRCLSFLKSLLQNPFLREGIEETDPLKELIQYVDDFYKNAVSSQKLVDFELLQTTRKTRELKVEWCKFLLLLLAAAVQDEGREVFVKSATFLAPFLQLNIKDMLEVIISAKQLPADFAAVLFQESKAKGNLPPFCINTTPVRQGSEGQELEQRNEEGTPLRRSRVVSSLSELTLQSPASPLSSFIQSPVFYQKVTERVCDKEAAYKRKIMELETKIKELTRSLQMETDKGIDLDDDIKNRDKIIQEKEAEIQQLQGHLKEDIENRRLMEEIGALQERNGKLEEENEKHQETKVELVRYRNLLENAELYIEQQSQTIQVHTKEVEKVKRSAEREYQAELQKKIARIAELQQECEQALRAKAELEERCEKMLREFEVYRTAQEERRVETDESFVMEGETMSVVIDKQIGELRMENERLKSQLESYRQKLEDETKEHQIAAQYSSQQIATLQSRLEEEETTSAKAKQELEEKVERIQNLKDRVALSEHLADEYREGNLELQANLSCSEAALKESRRLLEEKEEELVGLTDALNISREQRVLQKKEIEEEMSSWREKVEASDLKADSALEEKQQVEAELKARTEEVSVLQKELSSLQQALTSKTAHAETLQEQVASLETDLGSKSVELESLQNQLSSAVTELGSKTSQVESLQSQVNAAESQLSCKETELESLQGKVHSLETELQAKVSQVENLVSNVSSLETELGVKTTRMEDLLDQVNLLQTEVGAKTKHVENLGSQVSSLQAELGTKTKYVEDLQSQMRCLESEFTNKTAKLESLLNQVNSQESELANSTAQVESLAAQVNSLRKELEVRNEELSAVMMEKGEAEASLQNVQAQNKALQSEMESLEEQLSDEMDRARKEKQEAEVLHQADLEERRSAEKALQERITAVEAQLEEERTSHTAQLEALTRAGVSKHEKQTAIEVQLKSENSRLKSELEQRSRSHDTLQSEVSKLEARVREMISSHYEELEKEHRTLESQENKITALRGNFEEAQAAYKRERQERVRLVSMLQEKEAELERLRNELEREGRMENTLKTKLDEMGAESSSKEEVIQELQKEVVVMKEQCDMMMEQQRQEQTLAAAKVLEALKSAERVFGDSPMEQADSPDSIVSQDFGAQAERWCERLQQFAVLANSQAGEVAALREQVQQSSSELVQTRGELESCRQELGRVEVHSKGLQEQMQELWDRMASEARQHEESRQEKTFRLEETLQTLSQTVQDHSKEKADLQMSWEDRLLEEKEKFEAAGKAHQKAQAEQSALYEARLAKEKEDLEEQLQAQKSHFEDQLLALQEQLQEARRERDRLDADAAVLKRLAEVSAEERQGKEAEVRRELEARTDRLEQEGQAWQREREWLLRSKEKVETDLERWKETVEKLRKEASSWEEMYTKARTSQEQMQERWDAETKYLLQDKEKEMLAERNVLEAKLIRQKNLMQALREEKQSLEDRENKLRNNIRNLEEQNLEQHSEMASLKEEMAGLKQSLLEIQSECANYRSTLTCVNQKSERQRQELESLRHEIDVKDRRLKVAADNKELDVRNRELRSKLEELRKENKKLSQRVQRRDDDLHTEHQKSKELGKEVEELRQQLDSADKRIADYKHQLEAAGTALLGNTHANKRHLEAISLREEMNDSLRSGRLSPLKRTRESTDSCPPPDTPDLCFIQSPESRNSLSSASVFGQDSAVPISQGLRRQVPVGLRGAFMCEDEPPEFEWDRVSELTRRNTIVRPHLQSSYPIETQVMNLSAHTEEDMRHGRLSEAAHRPAQKRKNENVMTVEPGPSCILARTSSGGDLGNSHHGKRMCTYQRPGPPTPGSSGSRRRSLSMQSGGGSGHNTAHLAKTLSSPSFGQENSYKGHPPLTEVNNSRRESVAFSVPFSDKNIRRLTRQNAFIQGRSQDVKKKEPQGMPPPFSAPKTITKVKQENHAFTISQAARKPLASRNYKADRP